MKALIVNLFFAFELQVVFFCVPFCICKIVITSICNRTSLISTTYFKLCSSSIFSYDLPSGVSVAHLRDSVLTAMAFMLFKISPW